MTIFTRRSALTTAAGLLLATNLSLTACEGPSEPPKSARRMAAEAEILDSTALLTEHANTAPLDRVAISQQAYRLHKALKELALEPVSEAEREAALALADIGGATAALTVRAAHQDDFHEFLARLTNQAPSFIDTYLPKAQPSARD